MFQMTTGVVTSLKMNFSDLKERGLSKIQGEKVNVIINKLESVTVSLNEVVSLPYEALFDILKDLYICSCDYFKNTFQFQDV